jgi:hypothetical protein
MLGHGGKHWTIDCGAVDVQSRYTDVPNGDLLLPNRGNSANVIPAFLLRPVSRNSLRSTNGQNNKRPLSISPNAIAAAVAAASHPGEPGEHKSSSNKDLSGSINDNFGTNYHYNKMRKSCKLNKKKPSKTSKLQDEEKDETKTLLHARLTTDYNPTVSEHLLKHHRMHLPRQHSDAGAYGTKEHTNVSGPSSSGKIEAKQRILMDSVISTKLMKSSRSHPGIAMLRDNSCSLVDIPTYLGPSLQACGGVEVLTVTEQSNSKWNSTAPTFHTKTLLPIIPSYSNFKDQSIPLSSTNKKSNPGQEKSNPPTTLALDTMALDIEYREKQLLREKLKLKQQRKAKCTVLCVSLLLLTMCVTLVGTMLSIGSKYQVMID